MLHQPCSDIATIVGAQFTTKLLTKIGDCESALMECRKMSDLMLRDNSEMNERIMSLSRQVKFN
ncbi:MbeD/MobD family mobilization/exclusion protein [Yersinia ruckeri]|uniref:MbeD/MobD family mobilization/exclusion protein n=1 Tax=Enterobacterales TaxID=91347 RepID=UPI003B98729E